MDLVEIGFWGGASKCKGPEACLMGRKKGHWQLEQTGGLDHWRKTYEESGVERGWQVGGTRSREA